MDLNKTKQKLKTLSEKDLRILLELVQLESESRFNYQSNLENTPREMCKSFSEVINNAWIYG